MFAKIKRIPSFVLWKFQQSWGPDILADILISLYERLTDKYPIASEHELLNQVIEHRIKAPPHLVSVEEEYDHYKTFLQNRDKTLQDVVWAILEYEYSLTKDSEKLNKQRKAVEEHMKESIAKLRRHNQ